MSNPLINRKSPYELVKEAVLQKYLLKGGKPGDRLPSDRALAVEFGVNIATVAKGLTALCQEGRVTRRVGSGTYISDLKLEKQLVGIYLGSPVMSYSQSEMVVYAKLDQLLQQTVHNRNGNLLHYSDSRIREYWGVPHPGLLADVEEGKLSDLIVVRANPSNYAWLEKLPINVIGLGVSYGSGTVDLDLAAFSRQCVEFLVQQGYRKIGLITKLPPKSSPRAPTRFSLHESFHDSIRQAGIELQPGWVQVDDFDNTITDSEPMNSEMFGYTAFQAAWNAPERPDALIIHFDIVGLGVIRAARDLGVDLNRDIKTIFSANLGCDWPPLEGFTRMAFPIKDTINALMSLVGHDSQEQLLVKPVLVQPQ